MSAPDSPVASGPWEDESLDVRQRRTQARLREAVLRLAAEGPVEEIGVSDLVRAARINRTTFYKHATSPTDVLARVLYADLDGVRAGWLAEAEVGGQPVEAVWEHASGALLDHLERYDDVYTTGLTAGRSAVLYRLLVDHFVASVQAVLRQGGGTAPGEGPAAWRADAVSRFVAHGEAGLVEAWLALPRPRERRLFVAAAAEMLPAWLITGSEER
jgi:AcrR family transcriptional regulator